MLTGSLRRYLSDVADENATIVVESSSGAIYDVDSFLDEGHRFVLRISSATPSASVAQEICGEETMTGPCSLPKGHRGSVDADIAPRTAEAQPEMPERVLGKCAGLQFVPRGDGGILFQLMIEDDGNWHPKNFTMSTHWLDDLERVIQQAKTRIGQRPSEASPSVLWIEEAPLKGSYRVVGPWRGSLAGADQDLLRVDKAPMRSVWAVFVDEDADRNVLAGLFSSLEEAEAYRDRAQGRQGGDWTIDEWVVDGVALAPRTETPLPK